jgi:serine/threonine protein kinase
MTNEDLSSPDTCHPIDRELHIDEICDRFEQDWMAGERRGIEFYLQGVSELEGIALLRELLALELELRIRSGERPEASNYEDRFPNHGVLIADVFAANGRAALPSDSSASAKMESTHGFEPARPASRHTSQPRPDLNALASRYIVHEEVGHGATGRVFRATRRNFAMQVAIKVVSPSFSSERFKREAECLVNIRSPHVVTVHDFETLDNNRSVLVMEWIEGGDLERAMKLHGGRLPEHVALPWMRQTCEGMAAVAERDLIHRDLKPSNIMIDGQGRAKVTDFGLVRDLRGMELSATGQVLGTPYYMAPEQADDPRAVDTRSDIYSFGACFYHALTGRPPFDGQSAFSVLFKHKTEPLIAPKALNPEISDATSQLLERCLTKSPSERFQSFREVLSFFQLTPWDQLEDRALAEYIGTYQSRRSEYLSRSRALNAPDVYVFPEGRTLRILVGDIVEQDVEAVVSSDDWLLSKAMGVSKAILNAAGREILDELRCIPIRPGRAVVSSAGALKAKRIFHAVIAGRPLDPGHLLSRDVITEAMQSCFYHAESLFVRSIAFPLLGTGVGGFSEAVGLDTMFRFLARNLLRTTTGIREALIVLYPLHPAESHLAVASRPMMPHYTFWDCIPRSHDAGHAFFEYLPLDNEKLAMIMGSVPGHGLNVAVSVRELASLARAFLSDRPPEGALAHFNEHLCDMARDCAATILLSILDPRAHQITVFNAGHVPPFWKRGDGRVERLGESQIGLPVGVMRQQRYDPFVLTISPGETVVLVNEVVLDAVTDIGERLTLERLQQKIASAGDSRQIIERMVEGLHECHGGALRDVLFAVSFQRH